MLLIGASRRCAFGASGPIKPLQEQKEYSALADAGKQ